MKDELRENFGIDIDYNDIEKNLFCIGLASKPFMYKEIDKVFNKNNIEYMNYYKNSSIYKSILNYTLSADVTLYTEKLIGILEKSFAENNFENSLLHG